MSISYQKTRNLPLVYWGGEKVKALIGGSKGSNCRLYHAWGQWWQESGGKEGDVERVNGPGSGVNQTGR